MPHYGGVMRLTTAMLADAAHVQGGKLYVLGGGFEAIRTRSIPAIHRALSVALLLEVAPQERDTDLAVSIELIDEDGQSMDLRATAKIRVGSVSALPPGASTIVPLATPFYNVRFPEAKGYSFVVHHDDIELGRLTFRVVLEQSG